MNESDLGATFDVDRDLFPFTSRFMEMSNGAMVHYVDEGKGDVTFLMLHGNPDMVVPLSQADQRPDARPTVRGTRLSGLRSLNRTCGLQLHGCESLQGGLRVR